MNKTSSPALEEASAKSRSRQAATIHVRKARAQKARRSAHANGASNANGAEIGSREILRALIALKKGDFSTRLPIDWTGTAGKIADTFNDVAESMEQSTAELNRISRLVGKEGKINERLATGRGSGALQERVDSVNTRF